MKTICLYFEIHQPIHLKRYRFFDIGTDHYYYDDYENERVIGELFDKSYQPALQTMLDMIAENGKSFKVAFSISGVSLELIEQYAPEMLDLLGRLAATGCVEFLQSLTATASLLWATQRTLLLRPSVRQRKSNSSSAKTRRCSATARSSTTTRLVPQWPTWASRA